MSNIEFLKTLTENNVLELVGIFSFGLRYLGWVFIKGLVNVVDGLEDAISAIYNINSFFETKEVANFLNDYKPVLWTIFAIALAIVGFQIIFQRKRDKGQVPVNILISISIIVGLPFLMTQLNEATKLIVDNNIGTYKSSAREIVKGNLSDLYYLDSVGYDLSDKKNNISIDNIMNIDINEKLDLGNINNELGKTSFEYKLNEDSSGNLTKQKLDKGWFSFLDEDYYRYNLNFLVVICSLLVSMVAILFSCLKVGRILIELAFNKILATVLAFSDIGTGKKLKMVVENILSMFAILITISVLLKLYVVFTGWLSSPDVAIQNPMVKLLALGAGSWAVIDGPNIIERIFGIDAGIKSSWGAVVAGIEGARMAGKGAKSVAGAGKKIYSGSKSAYSNIKDRISKPNGSIKDNLKSSEDSNNIKNNNNSNMSNNPNKKSNSDVKNNSNLKTNKSNKDGNLNLNKSSSGNSSSNSNSNMNVNSSGVNKNNDNSKVNLEKGTLKDNSNQKETSVNSSKGNIGDIKNNSSSAEKEKLLKEAILKNKNRSANNGQGINNDNKEKSDKFSKAINKNENYKGNGQINKFNSSGVKESKYSGSNMKSNYNNVSESKKFIIGDKSKFNIKNKGGKKKI
ncbi:pLS20_p028 family conjugation system transmembrane protein [Clostridium perfringens]